MPITDMDTGFVFLGLLTAVQVIDHFIHHKLLETSETVAKWFDFHLRRIMTFAGVNKESASKFAYYIAMGETAQWYVMTMLINLVGAGMVVGLMNPLLLVPYGVTILATFGIIIKSANSKKGFANSQKEYLQKVQDLERTLLISQFFKRDINIDSEWLRNLNPDFNKYLSKTKLFNGVLMILNKTCSSCNRVIYR